MIKFNQPKYILPLMLLPFIYLFFYLFEEAFGAGKQPAVLVETTAINPALPSPSLDASNAKDKFGAFLEAYKHKRTETAIREIDERGELASMSDSLPESSYQEPILETPISIGELPATPVRDGSVIKVDQEVENTHESYAEQMKIFKAQMNYVDNLFREEEQREEAVPPHDNLDTHGVEDGGIQSTGKENHGGGKTSGQPSDQTWMDEAVQMVEKRSQRYSGHFHTISRNMEHHFIKAIIDEDLKVSASERIRIRLLEDVLIGEQNIHRGQYLYGVVTSFQPQRVGIHISSLALEDEIIPLALDIYDLDGLPGLFVPASQFREIARNMGDNLSTSQEIPLGNPPETTTGMIYDASKDAFNTASKGIAKAIRKQKANIKYGTQVYLVNRANTKHP